MMYYAITGVMSLVGFLVQRRLKSKFAKYNQVPISSGLNGKQIAENMLKHYGIFDVNVVQGQGFLSDHYNPGSKTISLSPEIYNGRTVMAAAVSAHECGHAVQHDTQYSMLTLRSMIVPVVQFASMAQQYLLIAAFSLANVFPQLMLVTIIAFLVTTAFSIITLPVEFDASNRALIWLEETGTAVGSEHDGAKDALKWAAMTYVVSALSSLVMLLFLILKYSRSR